MSRFAVLCVLVAAASTTRVAAQAPGASSLVFVFDGDGARVNGERVRQSVASELGRPVVRITDDAARGASATLTMAFAGPDEWVLSLTRGEQHVEQRLHLRTRSVGALAHVAAALVASTERPSATTAEWVRVVGDEIVDPFADGGAVFRPARPVAMVDEIVDPFTPAATVRRYEAVIDPWEG